MHPTVSIVWLDDVLLAGNQFHSVFHLAEDTTHQRLTDDIAIHFLELPKLPPQPSDRPSLHRWGRFLGARTDQELDALAQEDPIMAEAKSALDSLSAQPDVQTMARERELALDAYWYSLGAARTEGRLEGRAEGRASVINIIRRQLTKRFGELPDWAEARIRTANVKQLEAWADAVLTGTSLPEILGPR